MILFSLQVLASVYQIMRTVLSLDVLDSIELCRATEPIRDSARHRCARLSATIVAFGFVSPLDFPLYEPGCRSLYTI